LGTLFVLCVDKSSMHPICRSAKYVFCLIVALNNSLRRLESIFVRIEYIYGTCCHVTTSCPLFSSFVSFALHSTTLISHFSLISLTHTHPPTHNADKESQHHARYMVDTMIILWHACLAWRKWFEL